MNEAIYPANPTASKTINWNPALQALPFSPIREVFNRAAGMKDVAHLSIGQPDFPTPEHIIEAHIAALRAGKTQYALDAGLPELRAAVAACYNKLYGIQLEPENVLITTGCGFPELPLRRFFIIFSTVPQKVSILQDQPVLEFPAQWDAVPALNE